MTAIRRATRDELGASVAEDDVDPCQQGHARWIVNDGEDGVFDAVVVTVGTCGAPQWVGFQGMPSMEEIKARRARNQAEARGNDGSESKNEGAAESSDTDGEPERKHSQSAEGDATSKGGEDGEETFGGTLLHSSELDDAQLAGKRVVVIGSGASGVEAVETALARGAKETIIIARQDKVSDVDACMRVPEVLIYVCVQWIIPRNMIIDTLISAQPFGREMPLRCVRPCLAARPSARNNDNECSFFWEKFITAWNYHGVEDLTPAHLGLFQGTPVRLPFLCPTFFLRRSLSDVCVRQVVNDEFLDHVRAGRCRYVRGDTQGLTHGGVKVSVRGRDSKPGDEGEETEFPADVVVLATGFKKPDVGFLPEDLFPESYEVRVFCG